jgi:glycosyltransferase involved in cell wall biosynthesis
MDNQTYILYVCHDRLKVAGAALSLLNLLEALNGTEFKPIILLRRGVVKDLFVKHGYECISFPYQLTLQRKSNPVVRCIRQFLDNIVNYLCILFVQWKLRKRRVSIVHSNSTSTDIGYYLAKVLHSKHVWHLREFLDLDFNTAPSKGWDDMYLKLNKSDYVIAITRSIFEHWKLSQNTNSEVLFDAVRSENDITINEIKRKTILFCAANLSDLKGANVAVEIFCKSRLFEDGYRLQMIGNCSDSYNQKLEDIARKYSCEGFVDFLGFQNNIKDYMVNAALFLMSSVNEAMGRVTIEAFFYGCPVLGHDTGGTSELIVDGENGFLYNSINEAVDKLKYMITNPILMKRIIKNAALHAKEEYSVESYRSKICRIYSSMIMK